MTDADFAALVSGSHRARFRAIAPVGFQTGTDPYGEPLDVTGGSITFDATADVWASGSITVAAPWPGPTNEIISVFGGEVFLSRGIDTGSGGVAWSPLGYFRISDDSQADAARGPVTLTLDDRMMTIIESRLIAPRIYGPRTIVLSAVEELVREVYPEAEIEFDSNSGETFLGRQVTIEENRYEGLLDFAEGLGQIVHFDERGVLRFRDVPTETDPVWSVNAGPGGVKVNANRKLTRDRVYNAVVARGEGMDDMPPVQAVAYDASPASPTRWGGPFGRIPRFYNSPFITTVGQARSAAEALLRRSIGAPYTVSLSTIPNPAMRPYDPIRVVYDDGTRETHVIDKITIPFDVETDARIETREQTMAYVRVE